MEKRDWNITLEIKDLKDLCTRLPQKRQGPEPSCSHTMRPQLRQLLMSLCFWARHSQACWPGSRTASLSWPSLAYSLINLLFFFVEEVLLFSWAWEKVVYVEQNNKIYFIQIRATKKMEHIFICYVIIRTSWSRIMHPHPYLINGGFDRLWFSYCLVHSQHLLFVTTLAFWFLLGIFD